MAISFIYHTPIQHLRTLKDNVQLISKSFRFNVDGFGFLPYNSNDVVDCPTRSERR